MDLLNKMIKKAETLPALPAKKSSERDLNPKQIYTLLEEVCRHSKFSLEDEPLEYIMSDNKNIFIRATAGSGKTTTTVIKACRDIFLRNVNPRSMVVLSFTVDSVEDLTTKFTEWFNRFNLVCRRVGISRGLDNLPNIRTLNSLTFNLLLQYKSIFGLEKVEIITSSDAMKLMSNIVRNNTDLAVTDVMIKNLISLHEYLNEIMSKVEDNEDTDFFKKIGMPIEIVSKVLASYRVNLKLMNKFHQSDTCAMIVEKAMEDPSFKKVLSSIYDYIIIDESQDVSEVVFKLLNFMIGENNTSRIIGDDDQGIYRFKGAIRNGCKAFCDYIPTTKICKLSVNRRCSENILDYARVVIDHISEREPLEIKSINQSNELPRVIKYIDRNEYLNNLSSDLKIKLDTNTISDVAIGYRKNVSCLYLVYEFMEKGIPFRVKDNFVPGKDKLSEGLNTVLEFLRHPNSIKRTAETLYKVSPVQKNMLSFSELKKAGYVVDGMSIVEILEEIYDKEDIQSFYEIPLEFLKYNGTEEDLRICLSSLKEISKKIKRQEPMKDIMPHLYSLFKQYYWNFIRKVMDFPLDLEEMVYSYYCSDLSYMARQAKIEEQEQEILQYTKRGIGVVLTTFHSMKGLEFEEVYLTDLSDGYFPSIFINENTPDKDVQGLIDDELRLFYVAVTRAKRKLTMFWSSKEVSTFDVLNEVYIERLNQKMNLKISDEIKIVEEPTLLPMDLEFIDTLEVDDSTLQDLGEFNLEDMGDIELTEEDLGILKEVSDGFNGIVEPAFSMPDESSMKTLQADLMSFREETEYDLEEICAIEPEEDFVDLKEDEELNFILGLITRREC